MAKPLLHVVGMHGLGDCIHQRAVLRQLARDHRIVLETSWPSLYHDLVGPEFQLARRPVSLRTQSKNAQREGDKFAALRYAVGTQRLHITYGGRQVLQTPSKTILEVMCNATGTSYAEADYRLPVPEEWRSELFKALHPLPERATTLPWLVYRPLVARPEWRGSMARNADPKAYGELFNAIREQFFVISVADLVDQQEWIVGEPGKADLSFHKGELVVETLAALFDQADLVFTSSGFAAVLGPAVGTPTISIIGGYEDFRCHDSGKRFAPYLAIGPRHACHCWTSACHRPCDKSIDLATALPAVQNFVRIQKLGRQDADPSQTPSTGEISAVA